MTARDNKPYGAWLAQNGTTRQSSEPRLDLTTRHSYVRRVEPGLRVTQRKDSVTWLTTTSQLSQNGGRKTVIWCHNFVFSDLQFHSIYNYLRIIGAREKNACAETHFIVKLYMRRALNCVLVFVSLSCRHFWRRNYHANFCTYRIWYGMKYAKNFSKTSRFSSKSDKTKWRLYEFLLAFRGNFP